MIHKASKSQSLSLLSGKGGSGKTIIALGMCNVLSEAGFKVLLIDCDIATHGATYFFENEVETKIEEICSISQLISNKELKGSPLSTKAGFDFIPSSLNPAEIQNTNLSNSIANMADKFHTFLEDHTENYEFVIFDCQAGYSDITQWVVEFSHRNLIILEPDVISSAALRVLYLQIGHTLKTSNTWQVFNKLAEEERQIYEKISSGTFFTNLPPIPFDWQVRAMFSLGDIPSITSKGSAFGLGVLRLMQIVLPNSSELLAGLEEKTVGKWYEEITEKLVKMKKEKYNAVHEKKELFRRSRSLRNQVLLGSSIMLSTIIGYSVYLFATSEFHGIWLGITGVVITLIFTWTSLIMKQDKIRQDLDITLDSLSDLENEIKKFETLIVTEPRLREYSLKIDN